MSISPTKLLVLSSITRENKDEKPTDCTLDYKSQPISLNKGDRISLFCYSIFNQSYNINSSRNTLIVSEHYHVITSSNKKFTIIEKVGGAWVKIQLSMPEGEVITQQEISSTRPYSVTSVLTVLNTHRPNAYSIVEGLNSLTIQSATIEFALQSKDLEIADGIAEPLDLNIILGFNISTTTYSVLRSGQNQLISTNLPKGTTKSIVFTEGNYSIQTVNATLDFFTVFITEINKVSTKNTYAVNYDEINKKPIVKATSKIANEKPIPFSYNLDESTVSSNALGQDYTNANHIKSVAQTLSTVGGDVFVEHIASNKVPYIEETSVIFLRFTPVGYEHIFRGSTISASSSLSVNGSFPIVVDAGFGGYLSPKFNQDIYTEIKEPISFSEVKLQLVTDGGEIWQNSSEYSLILRITPNEMICRTRISKDQRILENVQLAQEIGKYVNGDDEPPTDDVNDAELAKKQKEFLVLQQIPKKNTETILGLLKQKKETYLFFSSMF